MIFRSILITFILSISAFAAPATLEKSIHEAMADRNGTCVFVDCKSGVVIASDTAKASDRRTPCSTFKIWNTLIGLECRLVSAPDELFYRWDGETRFLPAWNKDQTLKEAFQASCVPPFQILAGKIGNENMQKWIDTIGYGDRDISSGIEDFWLPREGNKSILISPKEQALLIKKLVNGELPFSGNSRTVLKEVMMINKTSKGTFYGKTGTGTEIDGSEKENIGWFVGYVTSGNKTYSFACLVKGMDLSGKDSRGIIEAVLIKNNLL